MGPHGATTSLFCRPNDKVEVLASDGTVTEEEDEEKEKEKGKEEVETLTVAWALLSVPLRPNALISLVCLCLHARGGETRWGAL